MRKVRPESRRWIAPQVLGSPFHLPLDPSFAFVPFVPLPDPKNSAWAILCPTGCTTELIILPEHAGQWLECPTCGFCFLGPHPAQPRMVAEARARAAHAAAEQSKMAGVLEALAKAEPEPEPPPVAGPEKPAARQPQTQPSVRSLPPVAPEELPFAELVPEQSQALDVLEMLAAASREAARPPLASGPRRIVAKAKLAPKSLAKQEAKAAGALEELEKKNHRPDSRHVVIPEPPRRAATPEHAGPGDLTPEETIAVDALEALAEATIPARKAPPQPVAPPPQLPNSAPVASAPPDVASAPPVTASAPPVAAPSPPVAAPAPPVASPVTAARPAAPKKAPSRAAQRLALGAPPRRGRTQLVKRSARAAARGATRAILPAHARAGHGDLVLTWVVSLVIAVAIAVTGVACGLYDLALLGAIVFVGLPVARTVMDLKQRSENRLPY